MIIPKGHDTHLIVVMVGGPVHGPGAPLRSLVLHEAADVTDAQLRLEAAAGEEGVQLGLLRGGGHDVDGGA